MDFTIVFSIGLGLGFGIGYGVREYMSLKRHRRAPGKPDIKKSHQ